MIKRLLTKVLFRLKMDRILIVDDDPKVLEQLNELLVSEGYEVGFIPKSEFILPRLESDHFDLIIMDVNMPGISGLDMLNKLKSESIHSDVPVIMITGEDEDEVLVRCFDYGASDYIEKPITEVVLKARVKAVLKGRQYLNEIVEKNDKLRRQEIELEKQNAIKFELKSLSAQMNPHFIFNSLNSIQYYILEKDTKAALDYLSEFSNLMRKALQNSEQRYISLADEIDFLEEYLKLETRRFSGKISYELSESEDLDPDEYYIPPMLVQPYLENSIIHGLTPKEGEGKLQVKFFLEGDNLICEIKDDGVGRDKSMELKQYRKGNYHKSMGMGITNSRLEMLRSTESGKFNAEVIDVKAKNGEPKGTVVILQIPIDLN